MKGCDGAATSVRWISGVEALPSCLVVIATTTILYSVKGPGEEAERKVISTAKVDSRLSGFLTQFLQRVVVDARVASHSVFGIILGHGEVRLVERGVVDAVDEVRPVRLFRLEPRDLYGRRGHFVNAHVAGMRWNCKHTKKRPQISHNALESKRHLNDRSPPSDRD